MSKERIDILNREQFVDSVFEIINKLSKDKKSCTFAINGEWGCGKSFVLDMLEEKLAIWQNEETADNQYLVFHYNCWQYDYYDEPLVAITSALYDEAISEKSLLPPNVELALLSILCFIGLSTKELANNAFKELTSIDASKVHKKTKERIEEYKNKGKPEDNLLSIRESIEATKDILGEIAEEKTIVIIVDELDRCLPEYAIKVLERLHHLFDGIDNLIVVLAVDKNQLNQTVSQIFGFNTNDKEGINSYLRKFISFEIDLDKGIVDENYKEKYKEYISLFDNWDDAFDIDRFVQQLLMRFDSRTRDKIIEKALLVHKLVFEDNVDVSVMCVELLWVVLLGYNSSIVDLNLRNMLHMSTSEGKIASFSDYFIYEIIKGIDLLEIESIITNRVDKYQTRSTGLTMAKKILVLFYSKKDAPYNIQFDDATEDTLMIDRYALKLETFVKYIKTIH